MTYYIIEELGAKFENHANLSEKDHQQQIKNFKENYPDTPLPEYLEEGFNLARALSIMAFEIERLKTLSKLNV